MEVMREMRVSFDNRRALHRTRIAPRLSGCPARAATDRTGVTGSGVSERRVTARAQERRAGTVAPGPRRPRSGTRRAASLILLLLQVSLGAFSAVAESRLVPAERSAADVHVEAEGTRHGPPHPVDCGTCQYLALEWISADRATISPFGHHFVLLALARTRFASPASVPLLPFSRAPPLS